MTVRFCLLPPMKCPKKVKWIYHYHIEDTSLQDDYRAITIFFDNKKVFNAHNDYVQHEADGFIKACKLFFGKNFPTERTEQSKNDLK